MPSQVREYVNALRESISIPVGFHGHNNLGLAIGNSMAAVEAGAAYVDGSLKSLGGGAGNTQTRNADSGAEEGRTFRRTLTCSASWTPRPFSKMNSRVIPIWRRYPCRVSTTMPS